MYKGRLLGHVFRRDVERLLLSLHWVVMAFESWMLEWDSSVRNDQFA
jgi:hypothetical protein